MTYASSRRFRKIGPDYALKFCFFGGKNKNLKKQGADRQTGRHALSASGQIWPDPEWAKRRDDKSYVAAKSFPRWSRNRRFNRRTQAKL
jgi:hypothetical protein